MKKRIIASVLLVCVWLSGCRLPLVDDFARNEGLAFSEFTYTRPDLRQLDATLEKCRQNIADDVSFADIVSNIDTFYGQYDSFYTNLNLADIHYCLDMRDSQWSEEYNYCMDLSGEADAKLEQLYEMLASSQYRQKLEDDQYFGAGFFDSYTGAPVLDEVYVALSLEESQLQAAYYDIYARAGDVDCYSQEFYDTYGQELAQILVDLICVRQQIAEHFGYESYAEMTYENTHGRDYSVQTAKQYMQDIGMALSDIYEAIYYDDVWQYGDEKGTSVESFQYVQKTASFLGGKVQDAFLSMQKRELYDLTYSPHKYDGSFSIYLLDYNAPYVFLNPRNASSDKLDFAHEFGHFTNDYICGGSYVGTDVSEVQSQGMEYLSLCCAQDKNLTQYKLADSMELYVYQSAYGLFELEIYELDDEELTGENLIACYQKISEDFSLVQKDWNAMDFVNVSHFYNSPMYIVSYVVSNDLAMQLYEMELNQPGIGKEKFADILSSEDAYILDFADRYGLKNPFSQERITEVDKFFAETFLEMSQAA